MVNTLFKAVDKAPFAGKYAVQNSIHNLVKAPRSKERSQLLKAVTARQTSLAVRAGSIHYKRSRKREQKPKVTPADTDTDRRTGLPDYQQGLMKAVAITLLGQAAFLGSYIDGNAKAAHNDCLTQTTQIIHTFETQHQVVLTDDEAMSYQNKVCDT